MDRPSRSPGRPKKSASPSRPKKSRSSSRTRKPPKTVEPEPRPKSPRRSPARTRSPSRKVPKEKKSSPSGNRIINRIREKVSEIRDSLTPDSRIEEMVRASATRFEEVASDYISNVRRSTRQAAQHAALVNSEILAPNKKPVEENNVHAIDEPKKEFRHWIVALGLSLVVPSIVVAAQVACTKESCALVPPKISVSLRRFFDLEASLWYLGFLAVQLILSSLPLGFKADSCTRSDSFKYSVNGPAIVVLTSSVLVGLKVYLNFPILKVLDKGLPILITSLLTAVVLGVLLYIKAVRGKKTKRHEYGQTGNFFYDAWVGAEVNPRIGPLDIKTAIIRTSLLVTIIYDSLLIYKEVDGKALDQISVNVALVAGLQILFALDSILFESDSLASFTVTQDGTGLSLLIAAALQPFWITLLPKYLFLSRAPLNVYVAGVAGVISIFGLVIHRLSNHVKYNFKKKPSAYPSSDFVHSRSSPLYKSNLWGLVRHPNYLGALLVYTSWTIVAFVAAPVHWIPPAVWVSTVLALLVHINRVESRAVAKHGSAWSVYSSQVKRKLIPKVF